VLHRNDVALRLGRHDTLVAELSALAEQNPLDERVAGQLILALYRSGRQADGLEQFQEVRRRLAEELGTDPGPQLRDLHQQLLEGEPVVVPAPRASTPTPRQLPVVPRLFVGRVDELARVDKVLGGERGESPVLAVVGAAGIGKTTLALHWAHRAADRFPDGQLYADLRGYAPGAAASPEVVVRGFLEALGVPARSVPADPEGQVALYRSLVAGKRLLVVLDNARDGAHVLPLLPGSGTCTTLVTSRRRLTGLAATHGVPSLALEVLADSEAWDLLAGHLSEQRLHAEPEAVADLVRWCAGLPLAVGIVGARAASYPQFPLAALVDELRDADGLGAADTDELDTGLRAVFATSYRALRPAAGEAFALLGVAPGPDIGLHAVAALLAVPVSRASELLRHLEAGHLARQHSPGRYQMHDLVRIYAGERARVDHQDAADAALRRVIDFYARAGCAAEAVLYPYERPAALGELPADVPCPVDETAALAWLSAEYPCLMAAQESAERLGWNPPVWRLAWALDTFQRRQGHSADQLTMWRAAAAAADRAGEPGPHSLTAWRLGSALAREGELAEASDHLHQALALSGQAADPHGLASVNQSLAWLSEQRGDDRAALRYATSALTILRALREPMREAHALNQAGWYSAKLGDLTTARSYCETALHLAREHEDRDGEARTLDSLGYVAHQAGRYDDAVRHYEQALSLFEAVSTAYDYADTLERLADSHFAAGRREPALTAWRRVLALFTDQHRTANANAVRAKLDGHAV
jgi:tetratricopeptide (TPR) repeat protein